MNDSTNQNTPQSEKDLASQDPIEEAYKKGQEDGYKEAYKKGQEDGYKEGYKKGSGYASNFI